MLSGVTINCFLLSYIIVLALELLRLYLKMPWRMVAIFLMATLAWLTHGLYLWDRWSAAKAVAGSWGAPPTLFDWGLIAAWFLATLYLGLLIRRPTNAIGAFLLPLVLGMILAALNPGWQRPWILGGVVGGVAGLVLGTFASGIYLMIYR
ncbi:MAG: hypothetical protein ACK53L_00810, partial [Pirellulaceae bacterium]